MSRTLKQWEDYLGGAMPRVRLLSELGLNYQDMIEIAELIKKEKDRRPTLRRTTDYLVANFPCTFVAFLAAFAAHNTEREFWDALARLLGVTGGDLNNASWGLRFNNVLQHYHKPVFQNLGYIYVGNMRVHGGIPAYSLGDFFANMLMPAIEKPEYAELDGKELLAALLARSVVQLFTDSTVRNFFEYSGDLGVEFLESARVVARQYISGKQSPARHSLPEYVLSRLVAFLENREDERHGFRRPRVKFDPEGEGLVLELPEQPLSGADVHGYHVRWQLCAGPNPSKEESVRIIRVGKDILTELRTIALGQLLQPFQVVLSLPTEDGDFRRARDWSFDVRSQAAPGLLAFRGEDGGLLHWSEALPAQDLLLVYPLDLSLRFGGEAHVIHSPDLFAPSWGGWQANYISLKDAWSLTVLKGDKELFTIPVQKQLELPRLVGQAFVPNIDTTPLYVGEPPRLRVPLRPGANAESELKRWQIEVRSVEAAEPALRQSFRLSDMAQWVLIDETAMEFELQSVLGHEPKGTYKVHVRGPLETDVEFPIRLWPSLLLRGFPKCILPSQGKTINFEVDLPVAAQLEVIPGTLAVSTSGRYGRYTVEVGEAASRIDLNLFWPSDGTALTVPVSLPVPRLEWRIAIGDGSRVEWSIHTIHKPVDQYLQSGVPTALHVRLPGISAMANQIHLRLVDPDSPERINQRFLPDQSVSGSDQLRFVLSARDTINFYADVPIFEFQLVGPFGDGSPESVPVLALARDVDISNIRIETNPDSQFLLWDEPSPLRNRHVFIRSLWKAWEEPWDIKIPDDVRGSFDLLAAGYGLPSSWYDMFFYVASSWEQGKTNGSSHSTFLVRTTSPEEQIAWLDKQLEAHPDRSFLNHFERACIFSTIGDIAKRDHEIGICYGAVTDAKLKDLLAFHHWLEKNEPNTGRAVRMKLYSPEHLRTLFSQHPSDSAFRQRYLHFTVQTSLRPESALLLIEHENQPSILFHALRELIRRRDPSCLPMLASMIEKGRLSESDATDLLKLDVEFALSELGAAQADDLHLRLLSGLIRGGRDPEAALAAIPGEQLANLVRAENDLAAIKTYLGILVDREDLRGPQLVMDLFQTGILLGHEVTELLGKKPVFSMRFLAGASPSHAYSVQLTELAKKYPLETGNIAVGMFVRTPCGWGRVDAMESRSGRHLDVVSRQDSDARLRIVLYPDTPHSLKAILDLYENRLTLLGADKFFQCGRCGFVALTPDIIIREHTRQLHGGVGASFTPLSSHVPIHHEVEFIKSLPL